jgi:hypothetical protein
MYLSVCAAAVPCLAFSFPLYATLVPLNLSLLAIRKFSSKYLLKLLLLTFVYKCTSLPAGFAVFLSLFLFFSLPTYFTKST